MLKNIIVLVGMVVIAACGGSSTPAADTTADTTAPTVSTVTTDDSGADTALSSTAGETRVSGASNATEFFTITFDEAMDPATVIADNVTLTCNEEAVTIGTPATSGNIIWTIPVESDLTGYVACTLTLGVGLTDAAGNALASAATYAFNTQCSTDDDFIVDTLGFTDASDAEGYCWTYGKNGAPLPADSSTSFTIEALGQDLLFTAPADAALGNFHGLFKEFDAASFTATLELVGMSTGVGNIECDISARNLSNDAINAKAQFISGNNCIFTVNDVPGPATGSCGSDTSITPNTPFYLQLIWDGTNASAKYGTSLSALTNMTALGGGTTSAVALGSSESPYQVGILCESSAAGSLIRVGSFTIDDATATAPETQY